MKGYVSNIPLEKLMDKREEFWGTRVEGNKETWEFLKLICNSKEIKQCKFFYLNTHFRLY